MAYSYTASVSRRADLLTIEISEQDAGPDSIAGDGDIEIHIPESGEVLLVRSVLESGDGATVLPSAYSESGEGFDDMVFINAGSVRAAQIADRAAFAYSAPSGRLYWNAGVNAGTNNVIKSTIILRARE